VPSSGPQLPSWDVTETTRGGLHVQRRQKVLPKRHFSTDPEPFGVRTGSNGDPKEALKFFVPQDKGEGARRQEMDLTPAGSQKIHHRYNGEIRSHARHGENRVRREIPEKSAVRHVCVWEEGGWWGEEIF
jgi:hypothetical protein